MAPEPVTFFQDDGLRLSGEVFSPPSEPAGAVVVCVGFRGTRRGGSAATLAARLNSDLGLAVLLFDYTGFGDSEGPRSRFDPEQQVHDIRSAVSLMRSRLPAVPIAIYGNSFGAAMATAAAARDQRVAALFALCAFSSGADLVREQRPSWEVAAFYRRIEEDRLARVVTSASASVDPDWIMVRDPEAAAYIEVQARAGRVDRSQMTVADAERLASFAPIADAHRLRSRPSLFVHCELDHFIPCWHSEALAEAAGGRSVILKGYGHYAIYEGHPQEVLYAQAVDFFRSALAAGGDQPR